MSAARPSPDAPPLTRVHPTNHVLVEDGVPLRDIGTVLLPADVTEIMSALPNTHREARNA